MKQLAFNLFQKESPIIIIAVILLISSCSPKTIDAIRDNPSKEIVIASDEITARIWSSTNDDFSFPEERLNLKKTGICMSGGGTRAMVCAVGQLRALQDLGLLDDVGYISCVSGGSWASVPFTYYTKGAIDDNQLLGTRIAPEGLTLLGMSTLADGFLAGAANANLLSKIESNLIHAPLDEVWIKAVKESYMTPFGVYAPKSPKYFSLNSRTVGEICRRNPSLSSSDFLTVRNSKVDYHRPYLVVNSSISGPYGLAPFQNPEQLVVFNYTPLGVGSAKLIEPMYVTKSNNARNHLPVGGGFIEPFAFGATAPITPREDCTPGNPNDGVCISLTKPTIPYTIADASGTSSSAFVADFTAVGAIPLKDLSPREEYWPVPNSSAIPKGNDFMFGDGGNVENMGLITLLQRDVNKLIVFVNTNSPLNTYYDTISKPTPTKADMDFDVLALFGIFSDETQDMRGNKVFPSSDASELMTQFVRAKTQGKSVIATTTLRTVDNPWYGIPANRTIQVTWVYNSSATDYTSSLNNEIQDEILLRDLGDFAHFPQYNTINQNSYKMVQLTPKQINLLYQFSAWTVFTNSEKFKFLEE